MLLISIPMACRMLSCDLVIPLSHFPNLSSAASLAKTSIFAPGCRCPAVKMYTASANTGQIQGLTGLAKPCLGVQSFPS
eukprot:719426-Rhodomonas_salina.1